MTVHVNKPRQPSSIFNSVPISERWYFPIIERIEEFENSNTDVSFLESQLSDAAPAWVTQCLIKSLKPYWEQAGLGDFSRLNTRMIGAQMGAKTSVFDAFDRTYKLLGALRERDRRFWVKWFGGTKAFQEAMALYRTYSQVLTPQFSKIRTEANELLIKQSVLEQIHFAQGQAKGLTFMLEVRNSMKVAGTKREKEYQARMSVYAFALLCWEAIEKDRGSLTWPELAKCFDEFAEHKYDISEDSFKKILVRCGLKNLGQVGRPKKA